MKYQFTAYIFSDSRMVMAHSNQDKDVLDKWLHPDEKLRARKVNVIIDVDGGQEVVLGKVVGH